MSSRDRNTKVYVGNLSSRTSKSDLEYEFGYFGRLLSVWVAKNPPGFSYIEFDDPRDAEDAIKDLDGRELHGRRLRVEPSHGLPRGREGKLSISGRRPFHPSDRCYNCGESGHYAYDCDLYTRRRCERSRRSRSYSPRRRRRSDSRSRSRTPRRRRYSRSYSRSRSRSRRRSDSRSRSRSYRSRSRSRAKRSRSRSSRRSRSSDRRSGSRSVSRSHSR